MGSRALRTIIYILVLLLAALILAKSPSGLPLKVVIDSVTSSKTLNTTSLHSTSANIFLDSLPLEAVSADRKSAWEDPQLDQKRSLLLSFDPPGLPSPSLQTSLVKRAESSRPPRKKVPSRLIDDCSSLGPTWVLAISQCVQPHGSSQAYRILCEDIIIASGKPPLVRSSKWIAGSCAEYEVCVEHVRRRVDKYRVATCVGIETFTDMAGRAGTVQSTSQKERSGHRNVVERSASRTGPAKGGLSPTLTKRTPFRWLPNCSRFGADYRFYASRCQPNPSSEAYKVICTSGTRGARSIRGECRKDEECFQFTYTIARCASKEWLENASKHEKEREPDDKRSTPRAADSGGEIKSTLKRCQLTRVSSTRRTERSYIKLSMSSTFGGSTLRSNLPRPNSFRAHHTKFHAGRSAAAERQRQETISRPSRPVDVSTYFASQTGNSLQGAGKDRLGITRNGYGKWKAPSVNKVSNDGFEKRGKINSSRLEKPYASRLMKDCLGFTGPRYFSSICLGRSSPQAYFVYCVRIGAASAEQVPSAHYRGECDEGEICVEQAKNEETVHLSRAYCVSKQNFITLINKGLKMATSSPAPPPSGRAAVNTADSSPLALKKRYPPERLNDCSNYPGYFHYKTWCAPNLSRRAYRVYYHQPAEEEGHGLWQHNMGNCREDEFCIETTSKGPIIVTTAFCVSNKNQVDLARDNTQRLEGGRKRCVEAPNGKGLRSARIRHWRDVGTRYLRWTVVSKGVAANTYGVQLLWKRMYSVADLQKLATKSCGGNAWQVVDGVRGWCFNGMGVWGWGGSS